MRRSLLSRTGMVLLGFLLIGGYFLWVEHRPHAAVALPWLLLGACLIMQLFMHGGNGGHGGHGGGGSQGGPAGRGPENETRRAP